MATNSYPVKKEIQSIPFKKEIQSISFKKEIQCMPVKIGILNPGYNNMIRTQVFPDGAGSI